MALKPRYKRRIFWATLSIIVSMVLALIIIPPMISLNNLKPKIENVILERTGLDSTINGNINFSLLGGLKIAAHDLTLPNGSVKTVLLRVPTRNIFNLESAPLNGEISISGAVLAINHLTPPAFNNKVGLKNSIIRFKGKDYQIVDATLSGGLLQGIVRTNQHKYEFDSTGDRFHIINKNNNLDIRGILYSDGSAEGTLTIDTNDINEWFEFKEPKIKKRIKLSMDFYWNGSYGFKFSNIQGDNLRGEVELSEDGQRIITLNANNVYLDLSFLLGQTGIFYNTKFNLDLRGDITLADKKFNHLKIYATGTKSEVLIDNIIADDMIINGGIITATGAQNMHIHMPIDNKDAYCLFSGTPYTWKCSEFSYDEMTGSLSVDKNNFEIFAQSDTKMPEISNLVSKAYFLAEHGKINFQFVDIGGSIDVNKKQFEPSYTFAKNKNLEWLEVDLIFLPESMRTATGDFSWDDDGLLFVPHSKRWLLHANKGFFVFSGKNIKDWLPNIDLRSIIDSEYTISGNYKNKSISNLKVKIAGLEFEGRATANNIILKTELLNLDSFSAQEFVDDYDELQFLTSDPLTIPFLIGANISLSADTVIYNGNAFRNFVYSIRDGTQSFSVTDRQRGNLLVNIKKNFNKYDILMQLNKFVITDKLLASNSALNISDTAITGQATLHTYGQIAYDIWYNLSGVIDITFDNGIIHGLGIDRFYSNAASATSLNAEYLISDALNVGSSQMKSMRIIGEYDGGNFATTRPFILSMRHADATGNLKVNNGRMSVNMDIVMRGTSPNPKPISVNILPDGRRNYSLSQIMTGFDPDFLRSFVTSRDKF